MAAAFFRAVEADLQTLSQEARRSLPAVKDAAERVLVELRRAGTAVQAAGGNLSIMRSLTSQILHPFFFSCNYAEAPKKLLTVALGSIQRFILADLLLSSDLANLIRVLEIQSANPEEEVRLKVLQTLPLLVSQPQRTPEPRLLAALLSLSCDYLKDRSGVVKQAGAATVQQLSSLLLERAQRDVQAALARPAADRSTTATAGGAADTIAAVAPAPTYLFSCVPEDDAGDTRRPATPQPLRSNACMAVAALLQDLVLVSGGMPPCWLRRTVAVPRVLACDIIEFALREHAPLFMVVQPLAALVANLLVPLLLRQLPAQLSFPLALRFCRITRVLLLKLHVRARGPCRALLSLLVRLVHAAARGDDLGADVSKTLDRFGAAGARILAGAHRMLSTTDKAGAGSGGGGGGVGSSATPAATTTSRAGSGGGERRDSGSGPARRRSFTGPPGAGASSVDGEGAHGVSAGGAAGADRGAAGAAVSSGVDEAAQEAAQEARLLASVAAIRIAALPLWKCVLVLETLHSLTIRPHVTASLFATFDLPLAAVGAPAALAASTASGGGAAAQGRRKDFEHLVEALWLLLQRTVVGAGANAGPDRYPGGGGGGYGGYGPEDGIHSASTAAGSSSSSSFAGGGLGGSARAAAGGGGGSRPRSASGAGSSAAAGSHSHDADDAAAADERDRHAMARWQRGGGGAGGSGAAAAAEFLVTPEELDWACEGHAQRPLAGLACSDADGHLFTSTAGGLSAALAAAQGTAAAAATGSTGLGVPPPSGHTVAGGGGGLLSGIVGAVAGASSALASAAVSGGSSLLHSAVGYGAGPSSPAATPGSAGGGGLPSGAGFGDSGALSATPAGGGGGGAFAFSLHHDAGSGSSGGSAESADAVAPPGESAGLLPASLPLLALETIANVAAAAAAAAEAAKTAADAEAAGLSAAGDAGGGSGLTHAHFAASAAISADAADRVHRPLSMRAMPYAPDPAAAPPPATALARASTAGGGGGVAAAAPSTHVSAASAAAASKTMTPPAPAAPPTLEAIAASALDDRPRRRLEAAQAMVVASARPVLAALSLVIERCEDLQLTSFLLKAYQGFTYACGLVGCGAQRDLFLINLCRMALPAWRPIGTGGVHATSFGLLPSHAQRSTGDLAEAGAHEGGAAGGGGVRSDRRSLMVSGGGGGSDAALAARIRYGAPATTSGGGGGGEADDAGAAAGSLTGKHVTVLKTLFNIAHCLGGVLGPSWVVLIDTFEQFERVAVASGALPAGGSAAGGFSALGAGPGGGDGSQGSGEAPNLMMMRHLYGQLFGAARASAQPAGLLERLRAREGAERARKLRSAQWDAARRTRASAAAEARLSTGGGASTGLGGPGSHDAAGASEQGLGSALTTGLDITPLSPTAGDAGANLASASPSGSSGGAAAAFPSPDDDIGVLSAALASLFESSVYLPDAALVDLVSALCDLSVSALAASTTASIVGGAGALVATSGSGVDAGTRAGGGGVSVGGGSTGVAAAAAQAPAKSIKELRRAAANTTDVFTIEQAAAADAHEILRAGSGSSGTGTSGGVSGGASGGAVPSQPHPLASPPAPSGSTAAGGSGGGGATLGAAPSAAQRARATTALRFEKPPFALTRLMETCALNAWRLGAVWEPLRGLFRVLARCRIPPIRHYGLSALLDLIVAHVTGLTRPPKGFVVGPASTAAATAAGASDAHGAGPAACGGVPGRLSQAALTRPLLDFWRSPFADSRAAVLHALLRLLEETSCAPDAAAGLQQNQLNPQASTWRRRGADGASAATVSNLNGSASAGAALGADGECACALDCPPAVPPFVLNLWHRAMLTRGSVPVAPAAAASAAAPAEASVLSSPASAPLPASALASGAAGHWVQADKESEGSGGWGGVLGILYAAACLSHGFIPSASPSRPYVLSSDEMPASFPGGGETGDEGEDEGSVTAVAGLGAAPAWDAELAGEVSRDDADAAALSVDGPLPPATPMRPAAGSAASSASGSSSHSASAASGARVTAAAKRDHATAERSGAHTATGTAGGAAHAAAAGGVGGSGRVGVSEEALLSTPAVHVMAMLPAVPQGLFELTDATACGLGDEALQELTTDAFRVLQLLCDDFLGELTGPAISFLLLTLDLLARQHIDLNVSLTAINYIWKIADAVGHWCADATAPSDAVHASGAAGAAAGVAASHGAQSTAPAVDGGERWAGRGASVPLPVLRQLWLQAVSCFIALSSGSTTVVLPAPLRRTAAAAAPGAGSVKRPASSGKLSLSALQDGAQPLSGAYASAGQDAPSSGACGSGSAAGGSGESQPWLAWVPERLSAASPEARNSAVQVLFDAISLHAGSLLSPRGLRLLLTRHLIPLAEHLTSVAHASTLEDAAGEATKIEGDAIGRRRGPGGALASPAGGEGGTSTADGRGGASTTPFSLAAGSGGVGNGSMRGSHAAAAAPAQLPGGASTVRLMVHHSRDTSAKQWSETRVLVYRGVARFMRQNVSLLLPRPWFPAAWARFLALLHSSVTSRAVKPGSLAAAEGAADNLGESDQSWLTPQGAQQQQQLHDHDADAPSAGEAEHCTWELAVPPAPRQLLGGAANASGVGEGGAAAGDDGAAAEEEAEEESVPDIADLSAAGAEEPGEVKLAALQCLAELAMLVCVRDAFAIQSCSSASRNGNGSTSASAAAAVSGHASASGAPRAVAGGVSASRTGGISGDISGSGASHGMGISGSAGISGVVARPITEEGERYSFDMRVVDGALVRVSSSAEADPQHAAFMAALLQLPGSGASGAVSRRRRSMPPARLSLDGSAAAASTLRGSATDRRQALCQNAQVAAVRTRLWRGVLAALTDICASAAEGRHRLETALSAAATSSAGGLGADAAFPSGSSVLSPPGTRGNAARAPGPSGGGAAGRGADSDDDEETLLVALMDALAAIASAAVPVATLPAAPSGAADDAAPAAATRASGCPSVVPGFAVAQEAGAFAQLVGLMSRMLTARRRTRWAAANAKALGRAYAAVASASAAAAGRGYDGVAGLGSAGADGDAAALRDVSRESSRGASPVPSFLLPSPLPSSPVSPTAAFGGGGRGSRSFGGGAAGAVGSSFRSVGLWSAATTYDAGAPASAAGASATSLLFSHPALLARHGVLPEDLAAPKLEIPTTAERAFLRGMERLCVSLFLLTHRAAWLAAQLEATVAQHPAADGGPADAAGDCGTSPAAAALRACIAAGWSTVLGCLSAAAVDDESAYAAPLARLPSGLRVALPLTVGAGHAVARAVLPTDDEATAAAEFLALPPSALSVQATKLLAKTLGSRGTCDTPGIHAGSNPFFGDPASGSALLPAGSEPAGALGATAAAAPGGAVASSVEGVLACLRAPGRGAAAAALLGLQPADDPCVDTAGGDDAATAGCEATAALAVQARALWLAHAWVRGSLAACYMRAVPALSACLLLTRSRQERAAAAMAAQEEAKRTAAAAAASIAGGRGGSVAAAAPPRLPPVSTAPPAAAKSSGSSPFAGAPLSPGPLSPSAGASAHHMSAHASQLAVEAPLSPSAGAGASTGAARDGPGAPRGSPLAVGGSKDGADEAGAGGPSKPAAGSLHTTGSVGASAPATASQHHQLQPPPQQLQHVLEPDAPAARAVAAAAQWLGFAPGGSFGSSGAHADLDGLLSGPLADLQIHTAVAVAGTALVRQRAAISGTSDHTDTSASMVGHSRAATGGATPVGHVHGVFSPSPSLSPYGVTRARSAGSVGHGTPADADRAAHAVPLPVFPIKVWGFGLGGSYGSLGDGSLVVADGSKGRRQLERCKTAADGVILTLIAGARLAIESSTLAAGGAPLPAGHRSSGVASGASVTEAGDVAPPAVPSALASFAAAATGASDASVGRAAAASASGLEASEQAARVWLSLLATLQALVGLSPLHWLHCTVAGPAVRGPDAGARDAVLHAAQRHTWGGAGFGSLAGAHAGAVSSTTGGAFAIPGATLQRRRVAGGQLVPGLSAAAGGHVTARDAGSEAVEASALATTAAMAALGPAAGWLSSVLLGLVATAAGQPVPVATQGALVQSGTRVSSPAEFELQFSGRAPQTRYSGHPADGAAAAALHEPPVAFSRWRDAVLGLTDAAVWAADTAAPAPAKPGAAAGGAGAAVGAAPNTTGGGAGVGTARPAAAAGAAAPQASGSATAPGGAAGPAPAGQHPRRPSTTTAAFGGGSATGSVPSPAGSTEGRPASGSASSSSSSGGATARGIAPPAHMDHHLLGPGAGKLPSAHHQPLQGGHGHPATTSSAVASARGAAASLAVTHATGGASLGQPSAASVPPATARAAPHGGSVGSGSTGGGSAQPRAGQRGTAPSRHAPAPSLRACLGASAALSPLAFAALWRSRRLRDAVTSLGWNADSIAAGGIGVNAPATGSAAPPAGASVAAQAAGAAAAVDPAAAALGTLRESLQPAAFLLHSLTDGTLALLRQSIVRTIAPAAAVAHGASSAPAAAAGQRARSASAAAVGGVGPALASLLSQLLALLFVGAAGWSQLVRHSGAAASAAASAASSAAASAHATGLRGNAGGMSQATADGERTTDASTSRNAPPYATARFGGEQEEELAAPAPATERTAAAATGSSAVGGAASPAPRRSRRSGSSGSAGSSGSSFEEQADVRRTSGSGPMAGAGAGRSAASAVSRTGPVGGVGSVLQRLLSSVDEEAASGGSSRPAPSEDAQVTEACAPLAGFAGSLAARLCFGRICMGALLRLCAGLEAMAGDAASAAEAAAAAAPSPVSASAVAGQGSRIRATDASADGAAAAGAAAGEGEGPAAAALLLLAQLQSAGWAAVLAHCTAAVGSYVRTDAALARYRAAAAVMPDRGLLQQQQQQAGASTGGSSAAARSGAGAAAASSAATGGSGGGADAFSASVHAACRREWRGLSASATLDACWALAVGLQAQAHLAQNAPSFCGSERGSFAQEGAAASTSRPAAAAAPYSSRGRGGGDHTERRVERAGSSGSSGTESGSDQPDGARGHELSGGGSGGGPGGTSPLGQLTREWRHVLVQAVATAEPLPRQLVRLALPAAL